MGESIISIGDKGRARGRASEGLGVQAGGPGLGYWLKINGTGDSPFDDGDWLRRRSRWVGDYGEVSMFPRVPSIEPGDRLIEYAAGSARFFGEGRLFAVSEAGSEPDPSPHVPRPAPGRTGDPGAGPRARHRAGPAE